MAALLMFRSKGRTNNLLLYKRNIYLGELIGLICCATLTAINMNCGTGTRVRNNASALRAVNVVINIKRITLM